MEDKCTDCHIVKKFPGKQTREFFSSHYHSKQLFLLKGLLRDRETTLEIKVKDRKGREAYIAPVKIVPSQIKRIRYNDLEAPSIQNVEVKEIKQAVFLEATLGWDTNEFSNSIVEYGSTEEYGRKEVEDDVFVRRHRVRIFGLKPGRRYHYRVISRDIFGNASASEDLVFDTSKKYVPEPVVSNTADIDINIISVEIFAMEDKMGAYVSVLTNKDAKAYLKLSEPVEMDKHGFGIVPPRVSQITVCIKCHEQGISHPVGIRSLSSKTRVPSELPTIEGGMITCTTCHYPHAGKLRYLSRLEGNRDLCVVCHTGAPYE